MHTFVLFDLMCATSLGNCYICLCCCALQRLRSHPSASASKRGRYIGQQPTRANQTHWWLFNQSPQRCGTRKNKPECVLAKVVYLTLEASSEPWNLMSGEQIRLSLSSSPCVSVLVLPLEQQQRETSALHLTTETRYWKTIVQFAVQHSAHRYICPFIHCLLSCGCPCVSQSQVLQRQPLLSLLGCQCLKRELKGGAGTGGRGVAGDRTPVMRRHFKKKCNHVSATS